MVDKVHHVKILCKNIEKTLNIFQEKLGFTLYCIKQSNDNAQKCLVLRQQHMTIVLCEGRNDTVYDIAFEVQDVQRVLAKFEKKEIIEEAKTTQDIHGYIISAVVKTPVGNIVHTLLDSRAYDTKQFLPGHVKYVDGNNIQNDCGTTHYDHITYACHCNTSLEIISWYENHFDFSRFYLNDSDDLDNGYLVQSTDNMQASFGMRLTAMEFWKCAEIGLKIKGRQSRNDVKLVLAEPLPGNGPNQVRSFLNEHRGPGVQHIGLYTNNIINSVSILKERQVDFITPPSTYYYEVGKLKEAESLGIPFEKLVQLGILLDSEFNENDELFNPSQKRYLMQVFTKPLFDKETFFLEFIQRCGATGFGAGNIRALWRAIDARLQKC